MKLKLAVVSILLVSVFTNYGQDCKPYIPVSEGSTWEITNYSAKDKETGNAAYELVKKEETSSGTTFTVNFVAYDKKGEETFASKYTAFCEDGKFDFDMAFKMNGAQMEAYKDMDVEVDASKFELPSLDEKPGTALKDGSMTVKIGSGGSTMFTMTVLITERKLEAKESTTTAAGTFECVKLYQKISTKMMVKIETYSREWYAENVGLVKAESYNKSGKLTAYSELTKLERK